MQLGEVHHVDWRVGMSKGTDLLCEFGILTGPSYEVLCGC